MIDIGTPQQRQRKRASGPAKKEKPARRLVAKAQIAAVYDIDAVGAFVRADLTQGEAGYVLSVHTRKEEFVLAGHEGNRPRAWRSADRAISYIRVNFPAITTIHIYLSEPDKETES